MGAFGSKKDIYNNDKLLICPNCFKKIPELIIISPFETENNLIVKCRCMKKCKETNIKDYLKSIFKLQLPQEHFCSTHHEVAGIQYCINDSRWYCQECLYKHKQTCKKHQTIDYEFNVLCRFHEAQYSHYCEYCQVNLCPKCKGDEAHKTHQVIPIPSIDPTEIEQDFPLIPKLLKKNEEKINMFILSLFNNNKGQTLEEKRTKEQKILQAFENYQAETETFQSFFEHLLATKKFCKANPNYHLNRLFLTLKINLEEIDVSCLKFDVANLKLLEYLKTKFILGIKHIDTNEENVFNKLNRKTNECLFKLENHANKIVAVLQMNNAILISASSEGEITQWNTSNFKCIKMINVTKKMQGMILLENGHLACASENTILIINFNYAKVIQTLQLQEHNAFINCLFQLSDKSIAFGSRDNTIKIWKDFHKKNCIVLNGHTDQVNCIVEYKEGYMSSGSNDNKINYWNIQKGSCVKTNDEHTGPVRCLICLSEDKIASGSEDKSIKIWDSNYNCIATLIEHTSSVICLAQLDEQKLASGSEDKSIKKWDLNPFEYQNSLNCNKDIVHSLVNLSNGLLVSSSGNTIFVWDV